jgi:hypothetical protein
MAKEVGDRAGEGIAYGNLGNAYGSQGDYAKAIEYHAPDLAIAKEVGCWAGEGTSYANLGCAYWSQGGLCDIELYVESLRARRGRRRGRRGSSRTRQKHTNKRQVL